MRLISTVLVAFLAYKLGEQYTQIKANDYFLNRSYVDLNTGQQIVDYVFITNTGEIVYTQSIASATPFDFWTAKKLRNLIKTHAPNLPIQIEIVNPILIN